MKTILLYTCFALLLLSCNKSDAPAAPTANTILFCRDNPDGRSNDIYSISENGSNEMRLTTIGSTHSTYLGSPSWGPENKIFFTGRYELPDNQIYSMNTEGSGIARITNDPTKGYFYVTVSPVGRRCVYQREDIKIYTSQLDGSDVKTVTTTASWDPNWHPDGVRVVYATHPTLVNNVLENKVYIAQYDGANTQQISLGGARVFRDIFISPDGTKIAYTVGYKVFVSNLDGSGEVAISNLSGVDGSSKGWTSDGQWVLIEGYNTYTLNLVKADGTTSKRIGSPNQKFIDPSIR